MLTSLFPPETAHDGSWFWLSESYADSYEITFVLLGLVSGEMIEVTLAVGLPVWLVDR